MEIVEYRKEYEKRFIELNMAWIEKYFEIEPEDTEMLYHARDYIDKGAMIYFAVERGQVLATCMVIPIGGGVWEMCKFAADELNRGRGAGSAVFRACMDYAIVHGAKKLTLVTNHI